MRRTALYLVLLLMVSGALPAQESAAARPADSLSFKQLLSGSTVPITLKMQQLDGDWRRITLSATADANQGAMSPWVLMAIGMGGGMPSSVPTYYTKGQMVTLGAETYLVVYRPQLKQANVRGLMNLFGGGRNAGQEKAEPEALTPETVVAMSLLNLKHCESVSDIRPFDLKEEIAENEKANKGIAEMIQAQAAAVAGGQVGGEDSAKEEEALVAPRLRKVLTEDAQLKANGNVIAVTEEGETIFLRGTVASAALKKRAEALALKAMKAQGVAYHLKNELEAPAAKPASSPRNRPKGKRTSSRKRS